jgi:general L-amino acid transport system permease protein
MSAPTKQTDFKERPWNNPRVRSVVIQLFALTVALVVVGYFASNTVANLQRQGIASGFDFLGRTAGFDIIQHMIPYTEESSYGRALVVAIINTLMVSVMGVVLATLLGFLIGICRLSKNFLLSRLSSVYIETVRNIPLLLQLFFWYFAVLRALPSPRLSFEVGNLFFLNIRGLYVPKPLFQEGSGVWLLAMLAFAVAGIGFIVWARSLHLKTGRLLPAARIATLSFVFLSVGTFFATGRPVLFEAPVLSGFNFTGGYVLIPELVALLVALTVYTSAFIAEIVRAGILAVPNGQVEASLALGLSRAQSLRLVIVPQAMRVIVPPMTSQFLNLTKNSSLAAAIAYPDLVLVFSGTVLMQTGQAVEVIAITMGVYLTISLLISFFMNRYNRSIALVER